MSVLQFNNCENLNDYFNAIPKRTEKQIYIKNRFKMQAFHPIMVSRT